MFDDHLQKFREHKQEKITADTGFTDCQTTFVKELGTNEATDSANIALFIEEDSFHSDEIVKVKIEKYIIVKFNGQPKKTAYDGIIEDKKIMKHLILKRPTQKTWDRRNFSDLLNTKWHDHKTHIYLGEFTMCEDVKPRVKEGSAPTYTVKIEYTVPKPTIFDKTQAAAVSEILDGNNKANLLLSRGLKPIEYKGDVLNQFAVPVQKYKLI